MKRLLVAVAILGAFVLVASCGMNVLRGEGKKIEKSVTVDGFDQIDIGISSDINITVGDSYSVSLRGYENIINHISVGTSRNTLYVDYDLDDTWTVNDGDLQVDISVPKLRGLTLSGAPDANISGKIMGDRFKLDVSGASNIRIEDIDVNKFVADLSGASELEVKSGIVEVADFEISGAGNIEAFGMEAKSASTSISGAGSSELNVVERLDAVISGAGSVEYKGDPVVTKHVSGVGSVTKFGE